MLADLVRAIGRQIETILLRPEWRATDRRDGPLSMKLTTRSRRSLEGLLDELIGARRVQFKR